MNLKEVIESRYTGYISLKDLADCISEKYQCSSEEAVHVIADAIGHGHDTPTFFRKGRLGPEALDDFDNNLVYKNLTSQFLKLEKELLDGIPF